VHEDDNAENPERPDWQDQYIEYHTTHEVSFQMRTSHKRCDYARSTFDFVIERDLEVKYQDSYMLEATN